MNIVVYKAFRRMGGQYYRLLIRLKPSSSLLAMGLNVKTSVQEESHTSWWREGQRE